MIRGGHGPPWHLQTLQDNHISPTAPMQPGSHGFHLSGNSKSEDMSGMFWFPADSNKNQESKTIRKNIKINLSRLIPSFPRKRRPLFMVFIKVWYDWLSTGNIGLEIAPPRQTHSVTVFLPRLWAARGLTPVATESQHAPNHHWNASQTTRPQHCTEPVGPETDFISCVRSVQPWNWRALQGSRSTMWHRHPLWGGTFRLDTVGLASKRVVKYLTYEWSKSCAQVEAISLLQCAWQAASDMTMNKLPQVNPKNNRNLMCVSFSAQH